MSAKSIDLGRSSQIVWSVLEDDCPALLEACNAYCDDMGLDLA